MIYFFLSILYPLSFTLYSFRYPTGYLKRPTVHLEKLSGVSRKHSNFDQDTFRGAL